MRSRFIEYSGSFVLSNGRLSANPLAYLVPLLSNYESVHPAPLQTHLFPSGPLLKPHSGDREDTWHLQSHFAGPGVDAIRRPLVTLRPAQLVRLGIEHLVQRRLHGRTNKLVEMPSHGLAVNLNHISDLFTRMIFWYIRHGQSSVLVG